MPRPADPTQPSTPSTLPPSLPPPLAEEEREVKRSGVPFVSLPKSEVKMLGEEEGRGGGSGLTKPSSVPKVHPCAKLFSLFLSLILPFPLSLYFFPSSLSSCLFLSSSSFPLLFSSPYISLFHFFPLPFPFFFLLPFPFSLSFLSPSPSFPFFSLSFPFLLSSHSFLLKLYLFYLFFIPVSLFVIITLK